MRGLTLTKIILHHNKNFRGSHPKKERNGKNKVRIGQGHGKIGRHHCSTLARIMHYNGDMKQRHVILTLVFLYTEWETHPLSLLKGDAPLVTHISLYLPNLICIIGTHISLLSQKRTRLRY
jgi:hypothetical protein